jgi:AbrB family looped-hinge helix DNA binding protein
MTLAKLKAKNQLTIPNSVVKRLNLKPNELFVIDIKDNYIKLTPVDIKLRK